MTEHDSGSGVIVRSVIDLGHNLGLHVVAEGAETEQQVQMLQMLECDAVQGSVYSKPLPAHEFEAWLRSWSGGPRTATA